MSQVSRFGVLGRAWRARPSPLRSNDGLLLLESFLVAAVISVLVIRWFLTLADFPRLGSGGLHIAHMLWGGAFMLVAILLLLAYLDRPVQHAAAFIAGLGFGTFIDEIGKFVTTDNDYFFRPAVSLIYVVFVVVFLVAHALVGQRRLTEREALANALDLLEPRLGRPIEGDDRGRIEDLLDQAGRRSGLVDAIARYLDELPSRPDEQSWWETIPRGFARRYAQVAVHPLFSRALTAVVLLYTAAAVVGSLLFVVATVATDHGPSAAALGQLVSTLLGAALVVRGVLALPTSHIDSVPMVPARGPRLAVDHPGLHLLRLATDRIGRARPRPRRLRDAALCDQPRDRSVHPTRRGCSPGRRSPRTSRRLVRDSHRAGRPTGTAPDRGARTGRGRSNRRCRAGATRPS